MKELWTTLFTSASLVLIVTGCGGGGSGSSSEQSASTVATSVQAQALKIPAIDTNQKSEFLNAINAARAQVQDCGVHGMMGPSAPLTWNDKLYSAAYEHSYDLAKSNTFSHTGSGTQYDNTAVQLELGRGSDVDERIDYYQYDWYSIGENIAAGQPTTASVIAGWIDSDGHCSNLMHPGYTQVGMALMTQQGSTYGNYWTQNFGKPQ